MGCQRTRLTVPQALAGKDMNAGAAAEVVGKMSAAAAGKVLGGLEPLKVVEIIEGAIKFKRWENPTLKAAEMLSMVTTEKGTLIVGLLSLRTRTDVLEKMDYTVAANIIDELEFPGVNTNLPSPGRILLSMNLDSALGIFQASTKKQALFRDAEWAEFQELKKIIDQRDSDIEGI